MATVKNVELALEKGTDRSVTCTWESTLSNVDHYLVDWNYYTGQGYGFEGERGTEISPSHTSKYNCQYTAPSNATAVRAWVKPVAKTHKVNGKDTAYWTGSWTQCKSDYYFSSNPPETPSTPQVEMGDSANSDNKYKLSVVVDNVGTTTDYMEFYFRKNSSTSSSKVGSVYAQRANLRCAAYMYVSPGASYSVAARGINSLDSGTKTNITLISGTTATLYSPVYSSWSSYSSEVTPPPDAPSSPKVSAYDKETVKMTWTKGSGATAYEIEYSTTKDYLEKSSGDTQSTTTSDASTTAYITGLDSGEEWFFRVRATNDAGNSGWSDIVSTVIGTTPEAPTTWSSTTTAMIGDIVNLYWVHNCEDGSDQSKAQIQITKSNGQIENVEITDDTAEYALDTSVYSDGEELTWRVRTAGITGDYSVFSTARTIKINAPATVALTVGEVMTSFPFNIIAEAGPETQKAISYYISIFSTDYYETTAPTGETVYVAAGEEIYSKFYNTSSDTLSIVVLALSVGDVSLEDGQTYKVVVTVVMNTGLSAENFAEFTVRWDEALYDPDASVGINFEQLTAYIMPFCEEVVDYEEGTDPDDAEHELVEGVTLAVYRREYDGTFTLIGDGIANDGAATIVDPHPALDYARYRIVVQDDATGQISYEDIPGVYVGAPYIVLQWDEDWSDYDYSDEPALSEPSWSGSMIQLPGNVDISESHDSDASLVEYIGREHPVSYYGTQLGESGSWSCDIEKADSETVYALRRLAKYMGDVYVREPSGIGYWARVTVSMTTTHKETVIPVSIEVTRVEGGV